MSNDTILGDSPSGSTPVPDGVVPGEEANGAHSPQRELDSETEEPTAVPGDPTTAFHRSRLYSLLAVGFERPGEEFQQAVEADAFDEELRASAKAVDDEIGQTALSVSAHVDDREELKGDWASLFGVEEGVTVSPYELTYMPGPLMTNVRKLADLSGFYQAFDLEIIPSRNDRRDHICFELDFLAHISLREAYLRTEDDEEGVAIVGDARRQFIEDHLGRWYWRFVDEVSQRDDGFYARLGDLLAALLETEINRLEVDPDWVPDDPAVAEWTEDVFGDSGRGCGGCGADPQGFNGPSGTSKPGATEPRPDENWGR